MSSLRGILRRYRTSAGDLGILLGLVAVLAYLAFELDLFLTEGSMTGAERGVALEESLALGTVLILGLLIFAIRRYRDLKREIARRTAAERKARTLAYQDPLTGLANRRRFEEALAEAVASPPERDYCHAVFLIDLNRFKQINDTYGHSVGDEVLAATALRLQSAIRAPDLAARLGGDEFVVLALHLLGAESAAGIARRLLEALNEPIRGGGIEHRLGLGIGIALIPGDARTPAEALRRADVALYRAKAERRPAYRFFEEEMDRLLNERTGLENALARALEEGRIAPRFSPSFDLKTGRVTGFEAIPSWTEPGGASIPPERFLPIAEETGLVHALGARVLEEACRIATRWPGEVTLAMDVLPGQIHDPEMGRSILAILDRTGFPPHRFEIEIPETTIVRDLEAAKTALAPLRAAGVAVALDNFGTGYSSLYHMREFRIDKVKIARRLVENMDEEETGRIVRALAGLGQGLGLAVSADGLGESAGGGALLGAGIAEGQRAGRLVTPEETLRLVA